MKRKAFLVSQIVAGGFVFSPAVLAHHGSSISYDMSKSIIPAGDR